MQLICPKCEMQVEIEDDGMPEKRRPVRCTSCGESWFTGGSTDLYALSFTKPSQIDPEVARILTEEAEREMAARKAEIDGQLSTAENGSSTKQNEQQENESHQPTLSYDGYERLNWRQWSFVLCLCLIGGCVALYVFAPNIVEAYPNSADWVFSYVFLVNDVRQSVYDGIQNLEQVVISWDIASKVATAKAWLMESIQAAIDFAVGLVESQEAGTES